jgi:hypothetical protein
LRSWSVLGALLLAQVLMLAAFLRLAGEAAGAVAAALQNRLGITIGLWIVVLVAINVIAIGTAILLVRWMRRHGFLPPSNGGPSRGILLVVAVFVAAVLSAFLMPSVIIAVVVLIAGTVVRLTLFAVALGRSR